MPINYQQVKAQTPRFCERAATHRQALSSASGVLMAALSEYGSRISELRTLIEVEAQNNKFLRCAIPLKEHPAKAYPLPGTIEPLMIIAADGSQINPSRHRQVDFGLINVATICIQPGQDVPPHIESDSTLLDDFDQENDYPHLTEDLLALMRDLLERAALLKQARRYTSPLITITDGPLELFRETGETAWFEKKQVEYAQILEECQNASILTAGYVDKPHSDLVNRMLRVALEKLPAAGNLFPGINKNMRVPDYWLFSNVLSTPGDRSAVFAIQSQWSRHFKGNLQLCFFYLNVGRPDKPSLARVELPAWCAGNLQLLNKLHAAIYRQCEIMGARPYPYILHRAHELAVVSYEETAQLEAMLAGALLAGGLDAGMKSNKQSAKDLPGRGRHP